jgi:hypothetical protein
VRKSDEILAQLRTHYPQQLCDPIRYSVRLSEARPPVGKWEYLLVSFQEHNFWRPRFINGQELEDWTAMPVIHDYANLLGDVGWELAGAASGALSGLTDGKQLCFKREKPST